MLTEVILDPIFWIIKTFLNLIPAYSLPASFSSGVDSFFDLIATTGYFLPLSTIATIGGLVLGFYGVKFVISGINWLIAKIPTIS